MLGAIRRLFNAPHRRSLDAAGGGRRFAGAQTVTNLNSDIIGGGRTIQGRASYFARNNANVAAAVNALVSNIIGPGIKPSSQHPDAETRAVLHDLFARWTDEADFDGVGDFYALQAMAVRQMVELGESFAHMVYSPDAATVPLQIRLLHPAQIPLETWPGSLVNGLIRAGVEFDQTARPIAYQALPFRPDDPMAPLMGAWNPVRLPAEDVCHLFAPLEPGQVRGLSWLAPVMLAIRELDAYSDASLVRAKLGALVCAALVDAESGTGGLSGDQTGNVLNVGLEPGTILNLPPGKSLEFFDPKESVNYSPFVRTHLQAIAAGLGIPYELLTGDLSQVNYSSIRAGLVEFRKRLEYWQHSVVVYRFCRPVWDRFIRMAALSGAIDAAAYAADPASFHKVEWLPAKQPWVDPKKDIEAEIAAVNAGFKSRTSVITGLGADPEEVDRQIAADQARAKTLGLNLNPPVVNPAAAPQEAPAND